MTTTIISKNIYQLNCTEKKILYATLNKILKNYYKPHILNIKLELYGNYFNKYRKQFNSVILKRITIDTYDEKIIVLFIEYSRSGELKIINDYKPVSRVTQTPNIMLFSNKTLTNNTDVYTVYIQWSETLKVKIKRWLKFFSWK